MTLSDELEQVVEAAVTVGDLGVAEGALRRLERLQGAPPGAGWAWLAAQGDEGARAALEAEERERP